jgi:hypothetical protein
MNLETKIKLTCTWTMCENRCQHSEPTYLLRTNISFLWRNEGWLVFQNQWTSQEDSRTLCISNFPNNPMQFMKQKTSVQTLSLEAFSPALPLGRDVSAGCGELLGRAVNWSCPSSRGRRRPKLGHARKDMARSGPAWTAWACTCTISTS